MRSLLFCVCWCFVGVLYAQDFSVTPISKAPLVVDEFYGVDTYGNYYTRKDRTLYKTGPDGTYQFTNLSLGQISTVDLINPLKLTVFFKNANVAVILDNTLTEIRYINFNTIENFRNVSLARTASDRNLWIFNSDDQQLELFNYNELAVTKDFTPLPAIPAHMASNFNRCWLATDDVLYAFNNFGTLVAQLPNIPFDHLQITDEHLIASRENTIYIKKKDSVQFFKVFIPELDIKQFYWNSQKLYIYDGQFLTSFQLQPTKPKD